MNAKIGALSALAICAAMLPAASHAEKPAPVTVVNPITLSPGAANPVTVVNPVTLSPGASLPVTIGAPVRTVSEDEPGRHPYQETAFASCQFAGDCAAVFGAVPGGARRVITHVSCFSFIPATPNATISGAGFIQGNQGTLDMFPVTLSNFAAGAAVLQGTASHMTLVYAEAGERLQAHLTSSGAAFGEMLCALSGYDVVLP